MDFDPFHPSSIPTARLSAGVPGRAAPDDLHHATPAHGSRFARRWTTPTLTQTNLGD